LVNQQQRAAFDDPGKVDAEGQKQSLSRLFWRVILENSSSQFKAQEAVQGSAASNDEGTGEIRN